MNTRLKFLSCLFILSSFVELLCAQADEVIFISRNDDGTADYIKSISSDGKGEIFFKEANSGNKWLKLTIVRQVDNVMTVKFPSNSQEFKIKMEYIGNKSTLEMYYPDDIVQFFELESSTINTDDYSDPHIEFLDQDTTVYEIYKGNIGSHKIVMYLGEVQITGTGRFWNRTGYYYFENETESENKDVMLEAYMGNAVGEGGYIVIHEMDMLGNVLADFEISSQDEEHYSGTWKSKKGDSFYNFFLEKIN